MENNIKLTPDAVKAIQALQHPCGTYQFYRTHLDRLFNYILNNSDEIGMSDNETMHTLRALNSLRADIADIAGPQASINEPVASFDSITIAEASAQLDEPREMLHDINAARDKLAQVQGIISEAIRHAENAGEKYESLTSDLNDINSDLEAPAVQLAALMAIDPDTYEPKEITNSEAASIFLRRAYYSAVSAYELAMEALDRAQRSEEITEERIEKIKAAHAEVKNAAKTFIILANQFDNTKVAG